MTYTPLADDLTKLIESYDDNPLITRFQREIWRSEGRKKAVTHGMLGKDHPRALKLLDEDLYDGKPVGSLSRRSAESFWYYNDNHVFPPEDDLIRLGIFMHLDLYRILALVLKGKWEEFFAREVCEWRANVGKNISEVLTREDEMEEALSRFNPNTTDLFSRLLIHGNLDTKEIGSALVHETGHGLETLEDLVDEMMDRMLSSGIDWLTEAGYTPETFDTLVQTMLLNHIHWGATDSPELDHFKKQAVEEIVICIQGTDDERQEYWRLTHARIQLLMDLDDLYVQIESTRLQNAAVNYKYLNIFGEYEIALREAKFRYYELEQKVMLKRANPDLTQEGLNEQVQKKIEEMEKKLKELREEATYAELVGRSRSIWDAATTIWGGDGGQPLTDEARAAYISKCKKLLRKIYLLIHPDRLRNDPVYEKLTSEQKEELNNILHEILKVKPKELGYPASYIESRYRSLDTLQEVLHKIESILKNAGINVNPELEIHGQTLPERLSWLEKDISQQEGYLESARIELQALINDEDIQQKKGILANEEKHDDIKGEMQQQTDEYSKKADELENELETLMAGDPE